MEGMQGSGLERSTFGPSHRLPLPYIQVVFCDIWKPGKSKSVRGGLYLAYGPRQGSTPRNRLVNVAESTLSGPELAALATDVDYSIKLVSQTPKIILSHRTIDASGLWDQRMRLWKSVPVQLGLTFFMNASQYQWSVKRIAIGHDFDFCVVFVLSTDYYEAKKHFERASELELGLPYFPERVRAALNQSTEDNLAFEELEKLLKKLWERLFLYKSGSQLAGNTKAAGSRVISSCRDGTGIQNQ